MIACPVIKVILGGERDAHKLAAFQDCRVKASEEQIARSLEGNWQEDLRFMLKQEQDGYEFCQKQMAECDRQLAQYLQQQKDRSQDATLPGEQRKGRLKKKRANKPQSKAFHVFDITGQSVLAAIPRTIGLAAAKCVEIDYSIGISQGQKIRMEIIVRITGSPEIRTSGSPAPPLSYQSCAPLTVPTENAIRRECL